jgi:hypothetical protein
LQLAKLTRHSIHPPQPILNYLHMQLTHPREHSLGDSEEPYTALTEALPGQSLGQC